MKAIVLMTLILTAVASLCLAAGTHMTIQTDTTIRIDPVTGEVKGWGHTQIKGIKIDPPPATTSSTGTSSTDTSTGSATGTSSTNASSGTTSTAGSSATSPDPSTASVSGTPPTDMFLTPTPVVGASASDPTVPCPYAQPSGQSN